MILIVLDTVKVSELVGLTDRVKGHVVAIGEGLPVTHLLTVNDTVGLTDLV